MKISIKLLLTTTLVLMLSACNTKTNNEETNSNAVSTPVMETTEDSSANSGASITGTPAVANHGGTTSSAGSSSHVQSTVEDNANNGSANYTNVNDNSGTSTGTSTNSNNTNNTSVGSNSEDTTDATGTSNDNNATSNNGNVTGNDQNHTGGQDDNSTNGGGNDQNTTGGSNNNHSTTLQTLSLTISQNTINKDDNTTVSVEATYSDGSTKELNSGVTWVVTPSHAVEVNNTTLTAKKDDNVTVQATVDGVNSNSISLTITWIVDAHTLPPEPDKVVNDATLLGVDSNDNGVRDDVERWIYEEYDHPIERGIFMQSARAYNKVIVDPSKAHETMKYVVNTAHCESYWSMGILRMKKRNLNYTLGEYRDVEKEIETIQFNTLDRHLAYYKFNKKLSGGVYGDDLEPDEWINSCEFDENGILGEIK